MCCKTLFIRIVGAILREMARAPITAADTGYRGTQLKMTLTLAGGQKVAFKPKWYVELLLFFITDFIFAMVTNANPACCLLCNIRKAEVKKYFV